jgi:hypothetical protein
MSRRANPNRRPWSYYPCGGSLSEEHTSSGIKLATNMRAGYYFGTPEWSEGEFFRATMTRGTFVYIQLLIAPVDPQDRGTLGVAGSHRPFTALAGPPVASGNCRHRRA